MKKARKKIFIAIMLCFAIQVLLLVGGVLFIFDGDMCMGIIWITSAVFGFFINLENLKRNRKYKKNGKLRFK